MSLTLNSLLEMGAFTGAPVEKEITWKMGGKERTATVYIKPLSYKHAIENVRSMRENGDALATQIAASVCQEDGSPVFTVADITGEADPNRGPLDGGLTMALLQAIGEVNGAGKR